MLKQLLTTILHKFTELNFYTSTSTNLDAVQTGRWATRLYLIFLIASIIILTFYSSLAYNTETVIILQPNLNTFLTLQTEAKQSLSCPCKEISIPQSSLVSFSPEFHQLCSSDFLSDDWFSYLYFVQNLGYRAANDWRYGVLPKFKFLEALCNLANNIVIDAYNTFGEGRFIASVALSEVIYNSQITVLIRSMINDATASFSRALDLIIYNKRYEQFLNYFGSSATIGESYGYVTTYSIIYNLTCNCGTMFTCTEQILLNVSNLIVPMPGWYIGCYMIDSLLDSTLESYYDKIYIDFIYASQPNVTWYGEQWNTSTPHPRPLDVTRTITSRFPQNTTVRNIINALFVEDWHEANNFEGYYQNCQPIQCSYTESVRKNLAAVVTTIIGLLGGLSTVLNIIMPNIVRFIRGPFRQFYGHAHRKVTLRRARVSPVAIISH